MKKTLALLLTLLLALGTIALADSSPAALVMRTESIAAKLTADGETTELPLSDLSLVAALNTNRQISITLAAFKGKERLALMEVQMVGDRLNLGIDGVDKTFEIEAPSLAGQDTSALPGLLRAALPALMGAKLPMIDAVPFPKADFTPLFKQYVTGTTTEAGAPVTQFAISERQVSELAAKLSEVLKSANNESLAGLIQLLDDYATLGVDLSFKGAITDETDRQSCEIEVYVNTGDGADSPTAILRADSADNDFAVSLSLPDDKSTYRLAGVNVTSDPGGNAMALSADALHAFSASLAFSQADGMQYVELDYDASPIGATGDFDLIYGQPGGMDFLSVLGKSGGTGEYEFTLNGAAESETAYAGSLVSRVRNGMNTFELNANYRQTLENYDSGFVMPAEIVPISEMDPQAVGEALRPLTSYFAQFLPAPEAEEN